jgi:hypothetical protein
LGENPGARQGCSGMQFKEGPCADQVLAVRLHLEMTMFDFISFGV